MGKGKDLLQGQFGQDTHMGLSSFVFVLKIMLEGLQGPLGHTPTPSQSLWAGDWYNKC